MGPFNRTYGDKLFRKRILEDNQRMMCVIIKDARIEFSSDFEACIIRFVFEYIDDVGRKMNRYACHVMFMKDGDFYDHMKNLLYGVFKYYVFSDLNNIACRIIVEGNDDDPLCRVSEIGHLVNDDWVHLSN